jgi:TetR/AcrR family tetracycline transcriptional repressor
MKDNRRDRRLARLDEMQRRNQERLEGRRRRMDERFDRLRERLQEAAAEPSDQQQRIVEAALELLKKDGLNNLSLREIAKRLGLQAPALYWYFKSKDALVDYMAEAILQKGFKDPQTRQADESWQDWLTEHMKRLRQAMLAYPDGARVVAGSHIYPAVTLGEVFESALESLHSAGLDLPRARHIVMTAATYTFGFVIEEQASPSLEEVEKLDLKALESAYPHMVKSMNEAHTAHANMDHDFLTGLQYIIRGAAA